MKTIKQICVSDLCVVIEDPFIRIYQDGEYTCIERSKAVELAQALLPEGKAIIDVPEGYEKCGEYGFGKDENEIRTVISFRKIKKPEFKWPEHLPDGTRLEKVVRYWALYVDSNVSSLDFYNAYARPEDRIEIPEWLEREPRTIVKGEG